MVYKGAADFEPFRTAVLLVGHLIKHAKHDAEGLHPRNDAFPCSGPEQCLVLSLTGWHT